MVSLDTTVLILFKIKRFMTNKRFAQSSNKIKGLKDEIEENKPVLEETFGGNHNITFKQP